jgi:hypothetical protein
MLGRCFSPCRAQPKFWLHWLSAEVVGGASRRGAPTAVHPGCSFNQPPMGSTPAWDLVTKSARSSGQVLSFHEVIWQAT